MAYTTVDKMVQFLSIIMK